MLQKKGGKMKKCKQCAKEFFSEKYFNNKKFCSKSCKNKYQMHCANPNKINLEMRGLSSGVVGTITELIVVADLLKKRYEVYRSLSPSCSGDIIAEKDKSKIFLKFEIRTGHRNNKNRLIFPQKSIRSDFLAIVIHEENKIIYLEYPSLKEIYL